MLKPVKQFIVVSVAKKPEEKSAGGIILTSMSEEKVVSGKVLAVGSGYLTDSGKLVKLEVEVGDVVMFAKHSAVEIKHDGESFFVLREESILSIVE
jgi:chaperonin GroES